MLRDINPGHASSTRYDTPTAMLGGSIYFGAFDDVLGGNLWKSDGTSAGTVPVKDLSPGKSSAIWSIINQNGTLFFSSGSNDPAPYQIWKSDGTEQGTVLVADD